MYGDGTNGALNVSSGTTNLLLDTKYQYTTVNVAPGATLSTSSTAGAILYILATTSITIGGTINLYNILPAGQSVASVTLDGVLYANPSVAVGGRGGNGYYSSPHILPGTGGLQGNGFGGGGGGSQSTAYTSGPVYVGSGGNGANGGSGISGGAAVAYNTTGAAGGTNGNGGSNSGGGSGGGYRGTGNGRGNTGAGGGSYGAAGADGLTNILDSTTIALGGGGGGGGSAGRPGVHIVLRAPIITITGTINVSGANGTNGGNGGYLNIDGTTVTSVRGGSGGGGGGGNAGSIYITTNTLTDTSATYTTSGGSSGVSGTKSYTTNVLPTDGTAGSTGIVSKTIMSSPYPGPFVRVWNGTSWIYAKPTVYAGGSFKEPKVRVQ